MNIPFFFKSAFLLTVFSCLSVFTSVDLEASPFRVGIYKIPPHIFHENHKASGAAVDYFNIIAERMGLNNFEYEAYPLSRLLQYLENGRLDAALFLAKNTDRATKLQFPLKPFFELIPSVAVTAEFPLEKVSSVTDLSGFRVGILQDSYVSPLLVHSTIHIDALSGMNAPINNLKKLLAKRLDAVFLPRSTIRYEIEKLNQTEKIKILRLAGPVLPVYTVFSKKVDREFIHRYEKAIQSNDSEIYQSLIESYIASRVKTVIN
ncbi:ABC transporter substrate-binding protein [uncultured Cocleimonas sp.]|uniref:substrate-binding periplasmic protein n=1 Tax=uncultured Cocleimonas sp. TaxID=1051587 RepID=UPI0026222AAB|nr:transporter substrate-binding domain-containing protein [uncultured Cocleimonas sp.]